MALLAGVACPPLARAQPGPALEPFDAIVVTGSAAVHFTQGEREQVRIEGVDDDTQLRELFDVRDGRLRLHLAGAWRFWRSSRPRIEVTARELTRVVISGAADFAAPGPVRSRRLGVSIAGSGSVRFDRLDADSLTFDVSGSGDGRVAGVARELNLRIAGRGELDAEQLQADRAKVSISGVGEVRLWAVHELSVAVTGAGRVDYWGSPTVRRSIAGAATINERGGKAAVR